MSAKEANMMLEKKASMAKSIIGICWKVCPRIRGTVKESKPARKQYVEQMR